jgi:hypothetical protein
MTTKLHSIEIIETVRETSAAILVHVMACLKVGGGMTGFDVWLPKSQIQNVDGKTLIPAWLANKVEREHNAIWSLPA